MAYRPLLPRIVTAAALAAVLTAGTLAAPDAGEYPSWTDVQKARSSEANVAAQAFLIERALDDLNAEAEATTAESVELGAVFYDAQEELDEAHLKVASMQAKVDKAQAEADESAKVAGQIAAATARGSGRDQTAKLLFSGDRADTLLGNLAMSSKLSDLVAGVYRKAEQDRGDAEKLTVSAIAARDDASKLAVTAENAMLEAQTASDAALLAVEESEAHSARLSSQLEALRTDRAITEVEYGQSVADRAAAKAAERAAEQAAGQPAAKTPSSNTASPSTPTPGAPSVSSSWTRPATGSISSGFGPRNVCSFCSKNHMGLDFSSSCNSPIVAAAAGRVVFAGPNGGYGNFVKIEHANGLSTGYAHIANGGIRVKSGAQVSSGQLIALVGTTGSSTGCHLHFEVRTNGVAEDPAPFLRARGVSL